MVQRKQRGRMRGPKPRRSSHPKSYKIVCASCRKEVAVQVPPPGDKNYYVWSASKNRDLIIPGFTSLSSGTGTSKRIQRVLSFSPNFPSP